MLQHESVLHPFIWPNNISLCGYTTFYISIHHLMGIWGISTFRLLWIMLQWTFVYDIFFLLKLFFTMRVFFPRPWISLKSTLIKPYVSEHFFWGPFSDEKVQFQLEKLTWVQAFSAKHYTYCLEKHIKYPRTHLLSKEKLFMLLQKTDL